MKKFLNFLFHTKYVYGIDYNRNDKAIYYNALYEECELKPNDIIRPMEDNIPGFHEAGTIKLIRGVYYTFSYTKDNFGCLEEYIPFILKIFKLFSLIKIKV